MIEIHLHSTAGELAATVLPVLLRREAENNLVIGLIGRMRDEPGFGDESVLASVHVGDEVVGAALRTDPRRLLAMSQLPESTGEPLAEALAPRIGELVAVAGPTGAAHAFAGRWTELKRVPFEEKFRQWIMAAEKIVAPPETEGRCAVATMDRLEFLLDWCERFKIDAGLKNDPPMPVERLRAMIEAGALFLWLGDDGAPRSMAAKVRESPNGTTIALVYTPREWRGRGYAGQCVAALCEAILAGGKQFVSLLSDAGNPTSTGLYRRLGFREVGQGVVLRFLDDRTG